MKAQREQVLIVDDDPSVRAVCNRALIGMGMDIDTAQDADEALKMVRSKSYGFVLTDVFMPGKAACRDLVERIKETSPCADVVIMTGDPGLDGAIPVLKGGACDYLIKPLEMGQLRALAARSIERRRLSEELNRERLVREELQAAYAELQKTERLKDALLSRVNHELCAALAALEGAAIRA